MPGTPIIVFHRRGRRAPGRRRVMLAGLAMAAVTGGSVLLLSGAGSTANAAPALGSTCHDVSVPIASSTLAAVVRGTLCTPRSGGDVPVQVLVAGGTYNRLYWSNLGTDGSSYVDQAGAAGYATLALDRIGTGTSTHPASTLVTGTAQADAVHQVITRARAGALDGHLFRKVVLVGHSLGSMVSVMTAGEHPGDIDALVLTGYSHTISQEQVNASLAAMHPAAEEGRPLDPGYLTTRPGLRPGLFHAAADSDPAITSAEEATKDVGATTELAEAATIGTAAATSRAITAPVLEANGGKDGWACAAVDCSSAAAYLAAEQPNYSRPLTTYLQPTAGHAVTLAADRAQVFAVVTGWLDTALHHRRPAHP
jgi:pimeloyl-ACP methyl ester carboxylesterase